MSALADGCADHVQSTGVPMVTGTTHKTWMTFPSVNPGAALDKVSRAVLAEGFVGVNVDKKLGTVTTQQETTGSGRPFPARKCATSSIGFCVADKPMRTGGR